MTLTPLVILLSPLFLGNLRGWEIVIIILAILLLFGAQKIPEMMRNMGKGVNAFKKGMRDMQDEISKGSDLSDKSEESDKSGEK